MSKQIWQPTTMLAPIPAVMVSCGTAENPNILTIAWTGIVNTKPAMTYISVQPIRYSYPIIRESGEFVINLVPEDMVKKADFCGVRSGRDTEKFRECGLTPEPIEDFAAPAIRECPVSVACRVKQVIPLGSHDMFLAEIVSVHVAEELVDAKGALHMEKARLAAYAHGAYYALGKQIGTFGYSVRKKPGKRKNRKNNACRQ